MSVLDWADALDASPQSIAAALAQSSLRQYGYELDDRFRLAAALSPAITDVPNGIDPVVLGQVYEAKMAGADRRVGGSHYTPSWLATGLVSMVFGDSVPNRILDPAVGGGVFLLAAADHLIDVRVDPGDVVGRLNGIDIDPWAVAVTEASLALWEAARDIEPTPLPNVRVGDALLEEWSISPDVVVGNPPFLTPLRRATTRSTTVADSFQTRLGFRPGPYADAAGLFLARGVDAVDPSGTVGLILPTSAATARDAAAVREYVDERASVVRVWHDDGSAFEANVTTFVPVLERGSDASVRVPRMVGTDFEAPGSCVVRTESENWSYLFAADDSPLTTKLSTRTGTLGDIARVTAGFRDEFYGIAECVVEAGEAAPTLDRPAVITSGLIDVGGHQWGRRSARIAKSGWQKPVASVAEVSAANARVGAWCRARLVPKVIVATQTKVIEPAIDRSGNLLPITPVVSVEPVDDADVFGVAAILLAPPVSRWLVDRRRGSGMSRESMRLSARDLAAIPLPSDDGAWHEAIARIEGSGARLGPELLLEVAALMTAAYGGSGDVLAWWSEKAGLTSR